MAVKNGVDLVIELPTLWSTSFAQRFAYGGVSLLNSLGCVDMLSFGSECGNIDELIECKNAINSEAVAERLKENLEYGLSFASARSEALKAACRRRSRFAYEKRQLCQRVGYTSDDALGK